MSKVVVPKQFVCAFPQSVFQSAKIYSNLQSFQCINLVATSSESGVYIPIKLVTGKGLNNLSEKCIKVPTER